MEPVEFAVEKPGTERSRRNLPELFCRCRRKADLAPAEVSRGFRRELHPRQQLRPTHMKHARRVALDKRSRSAGEIEAVGRCRDLIAGYTHCSAGEPRPTQTVQE